jgi:S1-C subfamily serine protease
MTFAPQQNDGFRRGLRIVAVTLLLGLGGYWAGSRWGTRLPTRVEAVPQALQSPQALQQGQPHPPTALSADEEINIRVYRDAAPAVANIITRAVEYDFFFNAVPVEGAASGFVIDPRGYILTNNHVVEGAQTIEVTLGDRSRFPAKLVGNDPSNDLAVIKIDPKAKKLISLTLADSGALQVGQRVLAIGNPFGFQSTLTTGVVSALGRTVQTSPQTSIDEAIQTDAAINHGNSGGPLLNTQGQVIGINTLIYSPTGATAGIGFAIPSNTARLISDELINEGRVRHGYLGVQAVALWPALAQALSEPVEEGLLVEIVTPGGPAARAGLRGGTRAVQAGMRRLIIGGDVIVAIDGQKVSSQLDLNTALNRKRAGDTVTLTFYRGSQKLEQRVTLVDR